MIPNYVFKYLISMITKYKVCIYSYIHLHNIFIFILINFFNLIYFN